MGDGCSAGCCILIKGMILTELDGVGDKRYKYMHAGLKLSYHGKTNKLLVSVSSRGTPYMLT